MLSASQPDPTVALQTGPRGTRAGNSRAAWLGLLRYRICSSAQPFINIHYTNSMRSACQRHSLGPRCTPPARLLQDRDRLREAGESIVSTVLCIYTNKSKSCFCVGEGAMPLFLATHFIEVPTARVPLCVVILNDAVKRKSFPSTIRCRMVRRKRLSSRQQSNTLPARSFLLIKRGRAATGYSIVWHHKHFVMGLGQR